MNTRVAKQSCNAFLTWFWPTLRCAISRGRRGAGEQRETGKRRLSLSQQHDPAHVLILSLPQHFVLKPQREGGGNNVYGEEVATTLRTLTAQERHAYIVMDLIRPPTATSTLMSMDEAPLVIESTSELGYFGTYIGDADSEVLNEAPGYLLRTKNMASREMGIAVGLGYIDSPLLI